MRALCLLLGLLLALPADAAPSLRRGRFKAEYREALDVLARGDRGGALEAVLELEAATIDATGTETIQRMRQAEVEVLEDLLPAGVEVLVPVILLHEQAYLHHRQVGRSLLALHSRTLVVDLVRSYAAAGETPAHPLASRLLTSLAGHLQEASIDSVAGGLYGEALELEPANPTALLALAYLRERRGDYARALPLLERLVALGPREGEAILRLGINRLRTGDRDAGRRSLESVLTPAQPEWIRSLAFQELARDLADQGDVARAEGLLRRAVREIPEDPSLVIQLSFLADHERGAVGVDLQGAMERSADRLVIAPRYRYSRMPSAALEELRREIARRDDQRLPVLTRALAGRPGQRAVR